MFERFTDRARRSVVIAGEEARTLSHNWIGSEHLLLGLLAENEGVAAQALKSLDLSVDAIQQQVVERIGLGSSSLGSSSLGTTTPAGHLPFTPRAKKVIEHSLREALQLGHNYIGTEHILLALVKVAQTGQVDRGAAAMVLDDLGVDLDTIRKTVIQLLSGYTEPKDNQMSASVVTLALDLWPGQGSAPRVVEILRSAAEDSDGEREQLLTWLANRIHAAVPEKVEGEYVHCVMWRNGHMGTLCDSTAYGLPVLYTAITEKATCPACRTKLDGGTA